MHFEAFWKDLEQQRSKPGAPARSLVVLRRTPSSHQLARRLLQEYAAEESEVPPIDVIAWEQTAGHGREGRRWSSPAAAGIYASLVRPVEAAVVPHLPMLVPVGLAELLNPLVEGRCRIKWPNDLVAGGGKLCGVLIDVISQGESRGAVISFGLNIAGDLSLFAQPGAVSMLSLGAETPSLPQLTRALVEAVERCLSAPMGDLMERYRTLSAHRPGDILRWRHRGEVMEGTLVEFDGAGHLRLDRGGEVLRLTAGELMSGEGVPAAEPTSEESA